MAQNKFIDRGSFFEISFEGITTHNKKSKGGIYINSALQYPNKSKSAYILQIENEKPPKDGFSWGPKIDTSLLCSKRGVEEAFDGTCSGLSADFSNYKMTDSKTMYQCAQIKLKLEKEILKKREEKNELGVIQLEEELEQIKSYMGKSTFFGTRPFPNNCMERARTAVKNAINRWLNCEIKKDNGKLYLHLKTFIKTGFEVSYRPILPVEWVFFDKITERNSVTHFVTH